MQSGRLANVSMFARPASNQIGMTWMSSPKLIFLHTIKWPSTTKTPLSKFLKLQKAKKGSGTIMARSGWKGELYKIELPMQKIRTWLFHEMIKINQKAGRVWLTEAVFGTPIPIWSGASRASFAKLASKLGWYIPSGPRASSCPFRKGHSYGMRFDSGTQVDLDKSKWYVGFQFATRLPHLLYNENNSPEPGPYPRPFSRNVRYTPYHFESRAQRTWKKYAQRQRLPNPFKYLKVKRIS